MTYPKHIIDSYMTPGAHTIRADAPVSLAQDMLQRFGIRHLPVLHGGKLVGVLSDRDIKTALAWKGANPKNITAEDVCSQEVYVTKPHALLHDVAREMAEKRYGCAVVMESDEVIGIFTTTDACRALADIL